MKPTASWTHLDWLQQKMWRRGLRVRSQSRQSKLRWPSFRTARIVKRKSVPLKLLCEHGIPGGTSTSTLPLRGTHDRTTTGDYSGTKVVHGSKIATALVVGKLCYLRNTVRYKSAGIGRLSTNLSSPNIALSDYDRNTQGSTRDRTTGGEYKGLRRLNDSETSAGLDVDKMLLSPNYRAGEVCYSGLRWLQANFLVVHSVVRS